MSAYTQKKQNLVSVNNNDLAAASAAAKSTKQTGTVKTQANTVDGPKSSAATYTPADASKYQYDPTSNAYYQQAMAALQNAKSQTPTYAGTWDSELESLYEQITNREKFKYDLNSDMLYQQYKDQYTNLGQMAMKDTMGQAAALTGGYGSSYAQSVGQQQYDAYLQQLNEVVPELYGMALDQYNAEGEQLYNQYAMLGEMSDREYGRYQDSLNQYWQNLNYLQETANQEYNRGYENWYNSQQMAMEENQFNYQKEQDTYNREFNERQFAYEQEQNAWNQNFQQEQFNYEKEQDTWEQNFQQEQWGYQKEQDTYEKQLDSYNRLAELITATGYSPSASELKAAGMSSAQAKAYKNYYTKNNSSSGGSSSSGSSGRSYSGSSSGGDNSNTDEETTKDPEAFSGVSKNQAVAYLQKYGAPTDDIMDQQMWEQQKMQYQQSGEGAFEVKKYSTYHEYLNAVVSRNMSYR